MEKPDELFLYGVMVYSFGIFGCNNPAPYPPLKEASELIGHSFSGNW